MNNIEEIEKLNKIIEFLHKKQDKLEKENAELKGEYCKKPSWKFKYFSLLKEYKSVCQKLEKWENTNVQK